MSHRTLVVVHGPAVPLSALDSLIKEQDVAVDAADITTDPAGCTSSMYSRAVVLASHADPAVLGATSKLLSPGSSISIRLLGPQQGDLDSTMLLSGFTECTTSVAGSATLVYELVDDEELLTEEDRQRPAAAAKQDDCEVGAGGARKACKNCTCGRAEAEAQGQKVQLTQEMLDNPQSSCGNCSLGDAFRCAGCPYRGLPAFEPGKKITLAADFLTADA
eukprot:gene5849-6090_t